MERSVALVPIAVLRPCGLERAKLRTGQRHLTDVARPGAGKFPARNGLAEQQVRHRLATARAGGPDHHPGLRLDAFELDRPPGHHRQHERRAGGEHRFEQALLAAGQIETGPRDVLADHDLRFAEHRHDNIGGTHADRCRARARTVQGLSRRAEHGDRARVTAERQQPPSLRRSVIVRSAASRRSAAK